ncbi:hypothetical protein ILYODFUR_013792 [Ilyodon furcidens]|uniref:Transmembrane protein 71 n=1 Tax=Ilyodon furcidens TaxID=33524 RepID=A0ABV0SNY1_9TELE
MLGARRRENLDLIEDQDLDWAQISKEGPSPPPLDESLWLGLNSTELDDSRSFTYDPTEAPPPPDKEAPPLPKLLIQEEICSEICQSKERFTQSLGGLSEVPPPPAFYSCCCQTSPEPTGLTMKTLLIIIFTIFILSVLYSGCLWWSAAVTSAMFLTISAVMFVTKSGPMGEWRRAKTEVSLKMNSLNLLEPPEIKPNLPASVSGHHIQKRVERDQMFPVQSRTSDGTLEKHVLYYFTQCLHASWRWNIF